jgi:hypothetical protein
LQLLVVKCSKYKKEIFCLFSIISLSMFKSCSWWSALDTTSCDDVCQWLATGLWFTLGTPVSSSNKIDLHDIIKILLKVVLYTINLTLYIYFTKVWPTEIGWVGRYTLGLMKKVITTPIFGKLGKKLIHEDWFST